MRRAWTILMTCALLAAMGRPLLVSECCTQGQCCGSDMCPMKARRNSPAAARPAENEMQCHKSAEVAAASSPKPSENCAMTSACGHSELTWNLPNVPRAILTSAMVLPGPQPERDELNSLSSSISAGFHSLPLHPPRT